MPSGSLGRTRYSVSPTCGAANPPVSWYRDRVPEALKGTCYGRPSRGSLSLMSPSIHPLIRLAPRPPSPPYAARVHQHSAAGSWALSGGAGFARMAAPSAPGCPSNGSRCRREWDLAPSSPAACSYVPEGARHPVEMAANTVETLLRYQNAPRRELLEPGK